MSVSALFQTIFDCSLRTPAAIRWRRDQAVVKSASTFARSFYGFGGFRARDLGWREVINHGPECHLKPLPMRCFAAPLICSSRRGSGKGLSMWEQTESLVRRLRSAGHSRHSSRGAWNTDSAGAGAGHVSRVARSRYIRQPLWLPMGIRSTGYKKRDQIDERREIVRACAPSLQFSESVPDLATSADLVDAAVAYWRAPISSQGAQ
jgi:hypothetical protein